jgi:hypothetical protein
LTGPLSVTFNVPIDKQAAFYDLVSQYPDIFTEFRITSSSIALYPDKNIFISYRRTDSEDICGRIYDRLTNEFSKENVFKDTENIPPGVDFRFELERAVRACNIMLVIIGQNWTEGENKTRLNDPDDFVRFEIETALGRDIPVIPVFVQKRTNMPPKAHLPASIHDLIYRNAREARPDPDFHKDMSRLITEIKSIFDLKP